jgi:hypothetical protein
MSRVRTLLLAALLLVPAQAHAFELSRIELLQQSVKTSGQSFVTGFGLRVHLKGGDLNDGLSFVPALEHWSKVSKLPELGVIEVQQGDWRIGGDLRYRFGDGAGWAPYAGAGLALDIVHSESHIQPTGAPAELREDSGRKLAPNFLIGVDTPSTGPIRSSFELNWHLVPDLKQFKINFGIGYEFGHHEEAAPSE